ncbi:MAG: WYL domain-containing protein [Bacteroidia bacterium]
MAIIEILKNRPNSTIDLIQEKLQFRDLDASDRSIRRDFKLIREEFGIVIRYNRSIGKYAIEEECLSEADSLIRLSELSASAGLIFESLTQANELRSLISFEHEGQFRGIQHLEPILKAAAGKRSIIVRHKHFITEVEKDFYINPLLLKEFQGRWYIYSYEYKRKHHITLGLDRILEIILTEDYFEHPGNKSAKELFSQVVGIHIPDENPQLIQLKVFAPQIDYFRTLPLHISQEEFHTSKEYSIFKYVLIPTIEFRQKVLSYGSSVQVIEPKTLSSEIKQELQKAIATYD